MSKRFEMLNNIAPYKYSSFLLSFLPIVYKNLEAYSTQGKFAVSSGCLPCSATHQSVRHGSVCSATDELIELICVDRFFTSTSHSTCTSRTAASAK